MITHGSKCRSVQCTSQLDHSKLGFTKSHPGRVGRRHCCLRSGCCSCLHLSKRSRAAGVCRRTAWWLKVLVIMLRDFGSHRSIRVDVGPTTDVGVNPLPVLVILIHIRAVALGIRHEVASTIVRD